MIDKLHLNKGMKLDSKEPTTDTVKDMHAS